MAFWGCSFTFNGIPCEDYELMMYNIGTHTHSAGTFASTVTIVEEQMPSKWKPSFYGVKFENKLSFKIVFGVNEERVEKRKYLTRLELDEIASWLTGHNKYMWLEINQEDMDHARFKCMITSLDIIEYGDIPWALTATVTCDSPYAYQFPKEYVFTINGDRTIPFYNESSHNGYYYPDLEMHINGSDFMIENETDDGRIFKFEGVPTSDGAIYIDNDHEVITREDGANMYPYFNFNFFRLKKGMNTLHIHGNGVLKIVCEFPVNPGS